MDGETNRDGKPFMQTTSGSGEENTNTNTPTGLRFLTQTEITTYLPPSSKTFATCPNPADKDKDVAKRYQSARLPTTTPALVFLGIDDRREAKEGAVPAEVDARDPKGVPYFALDVSAQVGANGSAEEVKVDGAEFVEPRLAGSSLGGWEANLFAEARALMGEWSRFAIRSGFVCLYDCVREFVR
jgi:hypothetical protein